MTPYLRIRGLSKNFGTFTALRDIDLDIYQGEFVCFLGPSGCGKTTLLRAIAGLDVQTTGTIEQGGRDISALPVSGRDFGIVFQSYALFPNLSVFENIAYGLQNQGAGKGDIRRRVDELLDMVGLAGSGPKYPAQLSGGQQQRVALARALAMSPGLLLLDEPLSALDARVRANLRDEIKRVQRRLGVTTIMVTHDQEEALAMADRIVVMNLGVIEQVGTPLEIYRAPGTRFVADFVGHMNFLAGTVDGPGQVRLGDVTIDCHEALNGVATGREVMVCVRPEDIVVRGLGAEARNVIPVHVDDLEFLGSFYRARLSPPGMDAGALTADFSVNAVRDLGLKAETSVPIQLPSDRIRVFATGR